jgi:hypothetical protein
VPLPLIWCPAGQRKRAAWGGNSSRGSLLSLSPPPVPAPFLGGALSATLTLARVSYSIDFFLHRHRVLPYPTLLTYGDPGADSRLYRNPAHGWRSSNGLWVLCSWGPRSITFLYGCPAFLPGLSWGVLIFLLVLSFLLWIWGHWFGPTRTLKENFLSTAILLVLITFSGWFTLDF